MGIVPESDTTRLINFNYLHTILIKISLLLLLDLNLSTQCNFCCLQLLFHVFELHLVTCNRRMSRDQIIWDYVIDRNGTGRSTEHLHLIFCLPSTSYANYSYI